MNNKYNIGEPVISNGSKFTIGHVDHRTNGFVYRLDNGLGKVFNIEESAISPYIEEETQEGVTPKYEVKDKVFYGGELYEIFNIGMDNDKYIYDLNNGYNTHISIKEVDLTPYVDRVIIESKKCERCLESYGILQENHLRIQELEELLKIAKVALKLTTELISTND